MTTTSKKDDENPSGLLEDPSTSSNTLAWIIIDFLIILVILALARGDRNQANLIEDLKWFVAAVVIVFFFSLYFVLFLDGVGVTEG